MHEKECEMVTQAMITDFLQQRSLAVVGVSRSGKKFGNTVFRELRDKGYMVYPVNPLAPEVEGEPCYASVAKLPEVTGAVVAVPKSETENVLREARTVGINKIWIQQGSETPEALKFCEENGMSVIHGECILMFAEPTHWFHRVHRGINRLTGKLPV
ncbi:MAG: CoA-binding protein [Candidatus Marinimicrobia bacterium]|nr:CoA-binding protein [Candidatus Neomarinimicrobiota bacterium]